ncbi:MuDR family transposase, partial [Striga hermonthica]
FIAALQRANPGTVVEWEWQDGEMARRSRDREFKFVFWAFGLAIRTFHLCPPIISIDGKHLRAGSYKGKLLVAIAQTTNKRLLPVAYAIVDEESTASWSFFLTHLRNHVLSDRQICLHSDRDNSILSVVDLLEAWHEPHAFHRICLRHLRSNVVSRYQSKKVRVLCWRLGSLCSRRKFEHARQQLQECHPEACSYLFQIPLEKWTLYKDNRRRWGTLTTNMSESYNNVLKGVRFLPCRALVQATMDKTLDLFQQEQKKVQKLSESNSYPPLCRLSGVGEDNSDSRGG